MLLNIITIPFFYLIYFQMEFIPMMANQNFQHYYSSLQCHMIIIILIFWCGAQKLNIIYVFVETMMPFLASFD